MWSAARACKQGFQEVTRGKIPPCIRLTSRGSSLLPTPLQTCPKSAPWRAEARTQTNPSLSAAQVLRDRRSPSTVIQVFPCLWIPRLIQRLVVKAVLLEIVTLWMDSRKANSNQRINSRVSPLRSRWSLQQKHQKILVVQTLHLQLLQSAIYKK